MKTTVTNPVKAFTLIALALAIAVMGIYVAEADDAPGAAVIGMLLMVVGVVLGVRAARNRLPRWAARTALAVGVVLAAFAAFLTHWVVVTAPLFPQSRDVPSVVGSTPSPQYAAAVERAREFVRTAVLAQNLPGVSVAVGLPSVASGTRSRHRCDDRAGKEVAWPSPTLFRHFIEEAQGQAGSVYGRQMYEVMRYWDDNHPEWGAEEHAFAAAWRNQPKWVVSRSLKSVGPNARLVGDDLEGAIRKLKAERDGEIEVAGPNLAQSLTALGLNVPA